MFIAAERGEDKVKANQLRRYHLLYRLTTRKRVTRKLKSPYEIYDFTENEWMKMNKKNFCRLNVDNLLVDVEEP